MEDIHGIRSFRASSNALYHMPGRAAKAGALTSPRGRALTEESVYCLVFGMRLYPGYPGPDSLIYSIPVCALWTLRAMREIYPTADWYATSHTHVPAYMAGVYYPEARPVSMPEQHFIVSGSFKVEDDLYAMRNHGGSGVLGLPTLMVYPDRHEIVYFRSPETALQVAG
jgi:hypothetical protein